MGLNYGSFSNTEAIVIVVMVVEVVVVVVMVLWLRGE